MNIDSGFRNQSRIIRAKKILGQNFLKNKKILEEIVDASEISKNDVVLEVGPGKGSLTQVLAERSKKVIAVEKDHELVVYLKEKFAEQNNIEIIEGDILKPNILKPNSYKKIVANLPYYITSHFLKLFLSDEKLQPELMVLMIQYEVAKRICARPPSMNPVRGRGSNGMNLLALSVQAYGKPKFIRKVSKNFFHPRPKVDSAIIKISDISRNFFKNNNIDEKKFFTLARRAFRQKRKMLRRSISIPKSDFGMRRPEELSLEDWVKILNY